MHIEITCHLRPKSVRDGDTWMNKDVILSVEWGTREFLHITMAERTGPLAKAKQVANSFPLMAGPSTCSGSQRYTRTRKLQK